MNESVPIKGDIVRNMATISYVTPANTARNAIVVLFGGNLYWQALDITSGLQEGVTDGLIIQLPQHAGLNAMDEGPRCREGPSQPAAFATLRPNRTAECPYSFNELVARITRLSVNTSLPDTVETVERVFGLPEMTTSFDDPRMASYMMNLSGRDGWKLVLWVREAFYPLDKGPAAFAPGLRPKRLGQELTLTGAGPLAGKQTVICQVSRRRRRECLARKLSGCVRLRAGRPTLIPSSPCPPGPPRYPVGAD
jgi:hypothetical protein